MKRPDVVSLLNWQQSVFWAFAGVVAVAACVSSTNRRLRAEAERVKLQEQRVELLERLIELQQRAKQQERQLEMVDDLIRNSSPSWFGWQQLPLRDLTTVLLGSKPTGG